MGNVLRRKFFALASLASATIPLFARRQSSSPLRSVMQEPTSQYADINRLRLYHEIYGEGPPVVLLHGGVSVSEVFGQILPKLAKIQKVIAVHLQGHGRTKDIDRPLRFELMADDVAALLAFPKISKADLLGYSMGGGVALQTTIRHSALVNRVVAISAAMSRDGSFPEVKAAFEQMKAHASQIAANIKGSPLGQLYPEVHWESLLGKIAELESREFDWSKDIQSISHRRYLSLLTPIRSGLSILRNSIKHQAEDREMRGWMAHCVRYFNSALYPTPRTTIFCRAGYCRRCFPAFSLKVQLRSSLCASIGSKGP
jgi:pimeloyl-ACP methyl ester carboxylesterase